MELGGGQVVGLSGPWQGNPNQSAVAWQTIVARKLILNGGFTQNSGSTHSWHCPRPGPPLPKGLGYDVSLRFRSRYECPTSYELNAYCATLYGLTHDGVPHILAHQRHERITISPKPSVPPKTKESESSANTVRKGCYSWLRMYWKMENNTNEISF